MRRMPDGAEPRVPRGRWFGALPGPPHGEKQTGNSLEKRNSRGDKPNVAMSQRAGKKDRVEHLGVEADQVTDKRHA